MSDPWDDEGFGGENDWGEESLETDLEEDVLDPEEPVGLDPLDDAGDDDDFDGE